MTYNLYMHVTPDANSLVGDTSHAGLRLTADEFFSLPEDRTRYELIDGVVMMSPSPTPRHQAVAWEIAAQLSAFLKSHHNVGKAFFELDVHIGQGPAGGDLVYRPDIIFVSKGRLQHITDRITIAPDLVIEIVSPTSRNMDRQTKKNDYERCGVNEYWIIDPDLDSMTFFQRIDERFVEVEPKHLSYASREIQGFELDLEQVRESFNP